MAEIKRTLFLQNISKKKSPDEIIEYLDGQVFLFIGDRFLCKQAAMLLYGVLQKKNKGNTLINYIDGTNEDPAQTLAKLQSLSLFSEKQIYLTADSRLFHSKLVLSELWEKAVEAYNKKKEKSSTLKNLHALLAAAKITVESETPLSELTATEWEKLFSFEKPKDDLYWADTLLFQNREAFHVSSTTITDNYLTAFKQGFPAQNILIILAESADKRHRLYRWIKKNALIVDCKVERGSTSAAQKEQKTILSELAARTLAEFDKKMEPACIELFFERVGAHPVAVVSETEKLAHYVGDRSIVTVEDVKEMVSNSREGMLYELTDALGKRDLVYTITTLTQLLSQGTHPLAILATLRNYLRKHLIFRVIQISSHWVPTMQHREFQSKYLPAIKENPVWLPYLNGHPYSLYINFTVAGKYNPKSYKKKLNSILQAEYRLKSAAIPEKIILEELLLSLLTSPSK